MKRIMVFANLVALTVGAITSLKQYNEGEKINPLNFPFYVIHRSEDNSRRKLDSKESLFKKEHKIK
jgi:hypothetical protein